MRITIKDIAAKAGVSKTTVSFAFNDPEKISSATYERVMAIASDLGYFPDPVARTLTTKRIGAIGLLLPQPMHEALRNPYLGELIQGIGAACLEHESALMIVPPVHGRIMEAARRAVVDALLAIGVGPDHEIVDLMRKRHIPLVTIDGNDAAGVPNVGIDDEGAAFELMSHVLGLGHRRVAIVELESETYNPPEDRSSLVCDRRMAGFRRALDAAGLAMAGDAGDNGRDDVRDDVRVYRTPCSLSGGKDAAARVLDDRERAIAERGPGGATSTVVAMSDIVAMGFYAVCAERGVRVPEDLSIASFDDTELSAIMRPGLTSLRQPGYAKGYEAGRIVLSMLKGGPAESATMPHELLVRGSTAAPRRRS